MLAFDNMAVDSCISLNDDNKDNNNYSCCYVTHFTAVLYSLSFDLIGKAVLFFIAIIRTNMARE